MIRKVSINNLYKYVKSNNDNSRLMHIVRYMQTVNEKSISIKLLCGNSIGTCREVSFYSSNNDNPCKECMQIDLQNE